MRQKFKKFRRLSTEEKKLFLEAYVTLGKMPLLLAVEGMKTLLCCLCLDGGKHNFSTML